MGQTSKYLSSYQQLIDFGREDWRTQAEFYWSLADGVIEPQPALKTVLLPFPERLARHLQIQFKVDNLTEAIGRVRGLVKRANNIIRDRANAQLKDTAQWINADISISDHLADLAIQTAVEKKRQVVISAPPQYALRINEISSLAFEANIQAAPRYIVVDGRQYAVRDRTMYLASYQPEPITSWLDDKGLPQVVAVNMTEERYEIERFGLHTPLPYDFLLDAAPIDYVIEHFGFELKHHLDSGRGYTVK